MNKQKVDPLIFRIASEKLIQARIHFRRNELDKAQVIIEECNELLKGHNHRVVPDRVFIYTIKPI